MLPALLLVPVTLMAQQSDRTVAVARIELTPAEVVLEGAGATRQLLVTGITRSGGQVDLTHQASYQLGGSGIAVVNDQGVIQSRADGEGRLKVRAGGKDLVATVHVAGSGVQRPLNFNNDVIPILSRFGCNSSGCHGKAEGQNGFKLSVFGFDAANDYRALVMEGRGRRVFPASPENSLLLLKAAGGMPHGGGVRLSPGEPEYVTLRNWITTGTPLGNDDDPRVVGIEVIPDQRILEMTRSQQLQVIASFSDGRHEDVTRLSSFQSNSDVLGTVDENGRVLAGESPGTVAVMATYMGQVGVFQAIIPRVETIREYPDVAEVNFIDRHVNDQLRKLNLLPSPPVDDATFLRRVYLDIIGTLPTAAEARAFLEDSDPERRARLVDRLLERPEFTDYWALKWSDLLRVDRLQLGHKSAFEYYRWIRDSIAQHKPLDQFTRDILLAEGPLRDSAAGVFYKAVGSPNKQASTLSQIFLGIRIECAECHHHPFDRWSQNDYFGMQSFFTQVKFKGSPQGEVIFTEGSPETKHPRSGAPVFAHPLGETMPEEHPQGDRRVALARWFTSGENPFFARNLANRTWAHFMGAGVVEPVDDVRLTNPPSNPALLDGLAENLVEHGFDFRQLIRTITRSAAYQRSSSVNESNARDEQNYSRYLFKQLEAEVFMDAISQTTGIGEKFHGVPEGSRAIQLWDSQVPHYLLKLFGRPSRVTACDCERISEPTVGQVLHVLNSPAIHKKISHVGGRIAGMVARYPENGHLVDEIYLTFFARFPDAKEKKNGVEYINSQPDRQHAAEDLSWSMMNSLEFMFNH
jgi:hypothetical protein